MSYKSNRDRDRSVGRSQQTPVGSSRRQDRSDSRNVQYYSPPSREAELYIETPKRSGRSASSSRSKEHSSIYQQDIYSASPPTAGPSVSRRDRAYHYIDEDPSRDRSVSRGRRSGYAQPPNSMHGSDHVEIFAYEGSIAPITRSALSRESSAQPTSTRLGKQSARISSQDSHGGSRASSAARPAPPISRIQPRSKFFSDDYTSSSSDDALISLSTRGSPNVDFFHRQDYDSQPSSRKSTSPQGMAIQTARPVYSTSYVSGFSDQMTPEGMHFMPGTEIQLAYDGPSGYKTFQKASERADRQYEEAEQRMPRHQYSYTSAEPANGRKLNLPANYTLEEHRLLRDFSKEAEVNKQAEFDGRVSFNTKYHNVWEKRKRQTGKDSVANHEEEATNARNRVRALHNRTFAHETSIRMLEEAHYEKIGRQARGRQ